MVDIGGLLESSRLIDWELDSIKTNQDETVARSLINYRHLKTEIQSQCFSLSAQQERLDEESITTEPLTVWVMGSWGALESVDGKTEDAEEYTRRKRELDKKIVMLKIQVLCLKQVHVSSCIRQLQVSLMDKISTWQKLETEKHHAKLKYTARLLSFKWSRVKAVISGRVEQST